MSRALNMLGLCARACRLVSGEKACVQAIRSGGVRAVVLDAAAAKNAAKSISDACRSHSVPLVVAPEGVLGDAIGKPGRMAVGITDAGFAEQILKGDFTPG